MNALAKAAEWFINLFNLGGQNFMGLVTGIIPTLVVLITFVNALIALIGQEKMDKFAAGCSKFFLLRYTVLPVLSMFILCNPMAYTFGRFLEEKYKPAFYDSAVSFCHPITGLFPHANAGELFVYLGIAQGITALGYSLGALAILYFIVGVVVILIRGIVTERLTLLFMKRR
ncbi:MAG: PTS glucitol/sorbitol transporter subunit IIC [Spirochaetales bacterium]|nr:PTS glucitol/sorbitol transporter subunit IIC [Spirochaetales bacterium]